MGNIRTRIWLVTLVETVTGRTFANCSEGGWGRSVKGEGEARSRGVKEAGQRLFGEVVGKAEKEQLHRSSSRPERGEEG